MPANKYKVLLLPGDGVGPEVISQAKTVLQTAAPQLGGITIDEADFGGIAIDRCGEALPAATLDQALSSDAVLLGAVGGPKYDQLPAAAKPEKGLLELRSKLQVFANLRPITAYAQLSNSSALRSEIIAGLDLLIVRELTGGIYFGEPRGYSGSGEQKSGFNTMRYTVAEIKRIAQVAFATAMRRSKRVCSVDKANVLEVSMLWRDVVTEIAKSYPQVSYEHMYVDNAAMQLVRNPDRFDVLLASNLFGDILSDLGAELVGSIGMMPSASIGSRHSLYEPIHGSAPDIAGQNKANPCGTILSVALMIEHSFDAPKLAAEICGAVADVLSAKILTADLCTAEQQPVSCTQMGAEINQNLQARLAA